MARCGSPDVDGDCQSRCWSRKRSWISPAPEITICGEQQVKCCYADVTLTYRTSLLSELNSLLPRRNSLFLVLGNAPLTLRKRTGMLAPAPPGRSDSRRFPCIFPADQGIARRDRFAPDSPHRNRVCVSRDFLHMFQEGSINSRDSAGFWRLGCFDYEPETAGFRVNRRGCTRLSLFRIPAVRFAPTADGARPIQLRAWSRFRPEESWRGGRQMNIENTQVG
jgi:hypothetical protein